MLGYAEYREVTSVVSEEADIVPEEVFEGLITTEVDTSSSTFALSPLEVSTFL